MNGRPERSEGIPAKPGSPKIPWASAQGVPFQMVINTSIFEPSRLVVGVRIKLIRDGKIPRKMRSTSETVEKANFGSLVFLLDPNFVVCPIW